MKKLFQKIKNGCINTFYKFAAKHPKLVRSVVGLGLGISMAVNEQATVFAGNATETVQNGITQMVSIVSTVVMGVGIIMAIMAIFNWVSAIHEEDSARQSKSIVRVVIAIILIIIKPVSAMIVKAVNSEQADTYMNNWG